MKTQTLILKVNFEDEETSPVYWNWNKMANCEDCIEIQNYGKVEKIEENE